MRNKPELRLEDKIDIVGDLINDLEYMRGLTVRERHDLCDYMMDLQNQYRKQHGEFYTPKRERTD